jgi:hypothetical protein
VLGFHDDCDALQGKTCFPQRRKGAKAEKKIFDFLAFSLRLCAFAPLREHFPSN